MTYTPATGFVGTATFTYKASDGTAQSNVATVTIQVTVPTNTAPVAANDSATANRGAPVTVSVLANDTDADGNPLTVTSLTQPASGTAVLNGDGTITYTPIPGFTGTASFTYRASDGTAQSSVATVTVQVLPPPPVTFTNTTSKAIPDQAIPDQTTITSTITATGSLNVYDVNVKLNLTHQRLSDLQVFLIAPDGTRVELFSNLGGTALTNTVFDDESATLITSGTSPYTGSFRPKGNLTLLENKPAAGTWTLEIRDTVNSKTGTLTNWSITIQG